jgi:hypothetical protein
MLRLEISITPKETSLLYEGDRNEARSWAIRGERIELYDVSGKPFATGLLGVLGAQYLPKLNLVRVSAINKIGERFSEVLPRRP